MAEEAGRAWKQLKKISDGRAWMRHVTSKDAHHLAASHFATQGKSGVYMRTIVVD